MEGGVEPPKLYHEFRLSWTPPSNMNIFGFISLKLKQSEVEKLSPFKFSPGREPPRHSIMMAKLETEMRGPTYSYHDQYIE
jgi:hypothetical protein